MKAAKIITIVSIVIIVLWLLSLKSNLPRKIKAFITSIVIASPIPPVP